MTKFTTKEIEKLLEVLIGMTDPVADSALDGQIDKNLMVLIDVINWCFGGVYGAARHRKSEYKSAREIGERAYAAMLEWKDWISECEEELA